MAAAIFVVSLGVLGGCSADAGSASPFDPDSPRALHFNAPADLSELGLPMPGESETEQDGIGVARQTIVNGDALGPAGSTHGVLSLWGWTDTFQEWRQICTATLITNQIALSARHCFTSPNFRQDIFVTSLENDFRLVTAGEFGPNNLDVALIAVHAPYVIRGSSTGFRRKVANGAANQTVFAVGSGLAIEGSTNLPSTLCNTGTQGCLNDRRAMRISLHDTIWDASRSDTGTQLGVLPNSRNQHPTFGDSGSALHRLDFVFGDLIDQSVVGVSSRLFQDGNGVWNNFYVPTQNFQGWVCQFAQC